MNFDGCSRISLICRSSVSFRHHQLIIYTNASATFLASKECIPRYLAYTTQLLKHFKDYNVNTFMKKRKTKQNKTKRKIVSAETLPLESSRLDDAMLARIYVCTTHSWPRW